MVLLAQQSLVTKLLFDKLTASLGVRILWAMSTPAVAKTKTAKSKTTVISAKGSKAKTMPKNTSATSKVKNKKASAKSVPTPTVAAPATAAPATTPAVPAKPKKTLKQVSGPTEKSFSITQKRNDNELLYTGPSMEFSNSEMKALGEERYDSEKNATGIPTLMPTEVDEFFDEVQPGDVIGVGTCAYSVVDKTDKDILLSAYDHKKYLQRIVMKNEDEYGIYHPQKETLHKGELDLPMYAGLCEILYRNGQVYGAQKLYFEVEEGQTDVTEP